MVGIIGVETFFGQITGRHRVIDALSTLAFAYPPRAKFFASELEQFLLLTREEGVDVFEPRGSYAGAMGRGQFIPSSYRAYAVDANADGRRDIWNDWEDVIGSVANYFKKHGWAAGQAVGAPATRPASWSGPEPANKLELNATVGSLSELGYEFTADLPASAPAAVFSFEAEGGASEYLGRLPQLPRHHALQPQPEVRARGASALPGHSRAVSGRDRERRRVMLRRTRFTLVCCALLPSIVLAGCAGSVPQTRPASSVAPSAYVRHRAAIAAIRRSTTCSASVTTCSTSSAGYRAKGVASWYGGDFHGLSTSSGEPYDMHAMTAAHTTLPLPTWVEVTNLANGKRVTVKVNDRGPFVDNRLIDLSYAAATELDMIRAGTARVEVRAVGGPQAPATAARAPATPPANVGNVAAPPVIGAASAPEQMYVQVGAFSQRANAATLVDRLRVNGFANSFIASEADGGRTLHRVRVGPLRDAAEFDQLSGMLRELGVTESHLVVDR